MDNKEFAEEFGVPEEEIQDLRDAFQLFDKYNKGFITTKNFKRVIKDLGVNYTNKEISDIVNQIDKDNSGEIEFDEFLRFMIEEKKKVGETANLTNNLKNVKLEETPVKEKEETEEERIIRAFKVFDTDNSGTISLDEFEVALCKLGDSKITKKEARRIFNDVDVDHNGELDYTEFYNFFKNEYM